MSSGHDTRAEALFLRAIELPREERAGWIELQTPYDPELRAEVLSLLSHHESADRFLARSLVEPRAAPLAVERIGAYEILGTLGEGGMGIVYLARQENPRRLVALKIARSSATSPRAQKRLAHEAQLLGRLEHPSIARIYEAGCGGSEIEGRPYFAMEFVRGPTITEYAVRHELGPRERLALVADVCAAVEHAHAQGVVHRDLKPGNVLVETTAAGPRVKVLDFGVARATGTDVRTVTMLTDAGQIVGTLAYMSPEQASGDSAGIDARADVYSLGVMAYEILSGRLPHDVRDEPVHEAVRILREEDPRPLSDVVPLLRGDVQTIVGKALERDPPRRYQRAGDLERDIRSWLSNLPIEARPPSRVYRASRFVRRHRGLVLATAAVVVASAAGVVGTTTQMVRAARERDRYAEMSRIAESRSVEADRLRAQESGARRAAERELRRAQALADMQRRMFESPDPTRQGRDVKVVDVLRAASASIGRAFAGDPELEIDARTTLGDSFRSLGLLEDAEREARSVFDLSQRTRGPCHADTLRGRLRLACVLEDLSRLAEAREHFDAAAAGLAEVLGADGGDALTARIGRAALLAKLDEGEAAETEMRSVLSARRRLLGEHDVATISAASQLGALLHARGKAVEAEDLITGALAASRAILGERHPDSLTRANVLATFLRQRGRLAEAEPVYRAVLDARRDVQGPRHHDTLTAMNNLAGLLQDARKVEEAETLFRETLAIRLDVLGEDHRDTLVSMNNLALLLSNGKQLDEAQALHERALSIKRRVLGERHSSTLTTISNLALVRYVRGDVEGALASYRDVLAASVAVNGARHLRTGQAHDNVGGCLIALRRYAEAETELLAAHDVLVDVQGRRGARTRGVAERLVDLYTAWGRPEDAATWRRRLEP